VWYQGTARPRTTEPSGGQFQVRFAEFKYKVAIGRKLQVAQLIPVNILPEQVAVHIHFGQPGAIVIIRPTPQDKIAIVSGDYFGDVG
jgi:hypothetical protein